jgi:hypothetical protein
MCALSEAVAGPEGFAPVVGGRSGGSAVEREDEVMGVPCATSERLLPLTRAELDRYKKKLANATDLREKAVILRALSQRVAEARLLREGRQK